MYFNPSFCMIQIAQRVPCRYTYPVCKKDQVKEGVGNYSVDLFLLSI